MAGFVLALVVAPVGLALSVAAMRGTRRGGRTGHGLAVAGAVIGGVGTVWLLAAVAFAFLTPVDVAEPSGF